MDKVSHKTLIQIVFIFSYEVIALSWHGKYPVQFTEGLFPFGPLYSSYLFTEPLLLNA